MAGHGGMGPYPAVVPFRMNVPNMRRRRRPKHRPDAPEGRSAAPWPHLSFRPWSGPLSRLSSRLAHKASFARPIKSLGLALLLSIALPAGGVLFGMGEVHAATCAGTGKNETTPADVYEARMTAKAANGAFDFSSGSMEAAKICADLINRLSSVTLSSVSVPSLEDVMEAIKDAAEEVVEETVEEACRYVANTTTNWVRSQTGYARQSANSTASDLVGARVNVSNPSASSVAATYRSRLRQKLPTYSDLPSLRDLR